MIATLEQHLADIKAPLALHDESRGKTAGQFWQECRNPGTLMWWAARYPHANSPETVLDVIRQIQTVLKLAPSPDIAYYTTRAVACYGALWREHGPETAVYRRLKPDLPDAAVWVSLAISLLYSRAKAAHPKQTATQLRTAICYIIRHSLVCPWTETPESKDQV